MSTIVIDEALLRELEAAGVTIGCKACGEGRLRYSVQKIKWDNEYKVWLSESDTTTHCSLIDAIYAASCLLRRVP